jgi:RimJ/RimL family protein N-acetyltransferase
MPDSVEIRRGALDDIESTWRCLDVVARERAYIGFLEAPSLDESRSFWSSMIEKDHPFVLAVDSGAVVGWCDVVPVPRPIFSHVGTLGMGLLPAYRGQGIGARLMTAALDASRICGLERVELGVFADNERARRLYAKMGFVVEGVRSKRAKIDGRYRDEILMARQL